MFLPHSRHHNSTYFSPTLRTFALGLTARLALTGIVLAMVGINAQEVRAQAPDNRIAADIDTRSYRIPAGALDSVLARFLAQNSALLGGDTRLTQGRHSPGLSGNHTVEAGLAALLQGTGLEAIRQPDNSYLLREAWEPSASGPGVTALAEVLVTAGGSDRTEGTGSYTAAHLTSSTATPLGLSLKDTPQSISVLTRQRLDDQALGSVREALVQTPGISVSDMGSERYTIMSRGYAINAYQLDGVLTTLDMTTQTVGQSLADLAIYDRVEVLRGASSLSIGVGDPAGTLNLIRKRPTRDFQGHVSAGIGSWDKRRIEADLSGPLNDTGTLRGRVVAAHQRNRTHIDYFRQEKTVLYGVLEADVGAATTLRAGIDYQEDDPRGLMLGTGFPLFDNNGTQTEFTRSTNFASRYNTNRTRTTTLFGKLNHVFVNDWALDIGLSHIKSDRRYSVVGGYTANSLIGASTGLLRLNQAIGQTDQEQTGIDIRLGGPFTLLGRQHAFVVGASHNEFSDLADYVSQNTTNGFQLPAWNHQGVPADHLRYNTDSDTTIRQKGIYAAARFSLSAPLALIVGGRYGEYTNTYRFLNRNTAYAFSEEYKSNGFFAPYVGLTYDLDEQHTLYASYTTIYAPQMLRDRSGAILKPREGINYELGVKSDWLDGRLTSAVAIYQIRQDNLAQADDGYTVPGTDNTAAYIAVKGARTQGIDIEINGELARGWNIMAGYTYGQTKDANGARIATTLPEHLVKLWTTLRLSGDWHRLTLGGGMTWQSATYRTGTPWWAGRELTARQGAYPVASLMAHYDFNENLSATLNINNLFDRKYISSIDTTFYTGIYGTPRNATLNVRYKF
ncbi:TonB-dependent siderophore receptor [Corticimicrobacter populi]|uniref:TonB-dependent siderophore receptor n=1 Tax=Corticimicrobacter populi TaxID=2175229 RepID=A0A2V1K0C1_9BURK|nr:TonB-dependent receptor [Corticimicrobacter populi]PWF22570.1 TonB-dependent siderophore receptor [Corticimicrobacter populi]